MSILKRALTVNTRQPLKSILLFLIIFVFATVLLVALSMQRAMVVTEERLLLQIPAVATIVYDRNENISSQEIPWRQPSKEEIRVIGALPFVRAYDFTVLPVFYSENLIWPHEDNPSSRLRGRPFEGRGINYPNIADVEIGVVQLIEGRTFTQIEIDENRRVAIIPRDIAEVNGLTVGSVIELENVVYNFFSTDEDDRVLTTQFLEVEVIGIIARDVADVTGDPDFFYMPFGLAEYMLNFRAIAWQERVEELLELDGERFRGIGQEILQYEPQIDSIFILNNPRELYAFATSANALLPDNWVIAGIDESIFAHVTASMDSVLQLTDSIQWVVIFTVAIILTLTILLFLHDRRREIGIYSALGEKKHKILAQIIIEIGSITAVSLILAIFVGNIVSESISTYLFEQHLIEHMNSEQFYISTPSGLELHSPGMMSVEEALSLYNVTLDITTLIAFVVIGSIVVLISTLIPIGYAVKLEAKDLLL